MDAGFEHPSEVQHESIPQAVLGGDIVCQAKSGMGKTAGKLTVISAEINRNFHREAILTKTIFILLTF